jgi:hypothetical protein
MANAKPSTFRAKNALGEEIQGKETLSVLKSLTVAKRNKVIPMAAVLKSKATLEASLSPAK